MELSRLTDANHTTTARLRAPGEDGKTQEQEVKIVYRPITAALLKQLREIEGTDEPPVEQAIKQASLLVKALPDITTDGQPVKFGPELVNALDVRDVSAILDSLFAEDEWDRFYMGCPWGRAPE